MPTSSLELVRTQLQFQILSPDLDLAAVRQAAARLDGQLTPTLHDYFADPLALPGLVQPSVAPVFQAGPSALFRQQPRLGVVEVADDWVKPYLAWTNRLKRSRKWIRAQARMVKVLERGIDSNITDDPIVAGLVLFQFGPRPESELRQKLLALALTDPRGGYLCAEALHTTTEREAILQSLADDSQAILGASYLPGFGPHCLRVAQSRCDLAAGMVVARLGSDKELAAWLRQTGLAAVEFSAAASAMLVLNPQVPQNLRNVWLATLHGSRTSVEACATVVWARHTWPVTEWTGLKDELRSAACEDRGRGWYHWFAFVENENAVSALKLDADPLWSFELVDRLNLKDQALRFRLSDQLGRSHYHPESSLVLDALNHRYDTEQERCR